MNVVRTQIMNGLICDRKEEIAGFWRGKTPCWKMCNCPESIMRQCPAIKRAVAPCWEMEGTYLKTSGGGQRRDDIEMCKACRVYRRYGFDSVFETDNRNISQGYPKNIPNYFKSLAEKLLKQIAANDNGRIRAISGGR